MKNLLKHPGSLILLVVCLGIAWAVSLAEIHAADQHATKPGKTEGAGRLVILRGATLGPTIVGIKIDGKMAAQINYNRRYDAPLAAGPHTLTVFPVNSHQGARPTDKHVTVEAGKTYTFTAVRQDIQLVLR